MFCLYRMSEAANHTLMTRSLCKRNSTGSRNGKPWLREFIYAQKSLFPQNKNYLTTTLIRFSSWLSSQSSFHQYTSISSPSVTLDRVEQHGMPESGLSR